MSLMEIHVDRIGNKIAHNVIENGLAGPRVNLDGTTGQDLVPEIATEYRVVNVAVYQGRAMDRKYHKTQIVPGAVTFIYVRESAEGDVDEMSPWSLETITVKGRRAKQDGTPSQADAEESYNVRGISPDSLPEWLHTEAQRFMPGAAVTA